MDGMTDLSRWWPLSGADGLRGELEPFARERFPFSMHLHAMIVAPAITVVRAI